MNKNTKSILAWIFFIGIIIFFTNPFNQKLIQSNSQEITYSAFVKSLNDGEIKVVYLSTSSQVSPSSAQIIRGKYQDGKMFRTVAPETDIRLVERLLDNNVEIIVNVSDHTTQYLFYQFLNLFPVLLIIGLMIYSVRQSRNGGKGGLGGGAFGFGKSRAKMFKPKNNKVTFKDVAGIDEAKKELEEIVDFLKAPNKFQRLGGKIPRGVLLVGAPGNGKTLLARAIAGEADVPFFSISGSDFVEVFVGVGASRVREMFDNAKKNSPCIVFIDEIDAVGRRRENSLRGGNDEREQTLNQLLVEMDGFDENQGVIVLAATNRADILDPALLRPGRFDRRIPVQYPDMAGREMILKVHVKNVPLAPDVNLKTVARGTPGFSGAELANLVNEAALFAARQNKLAVNMKDFEIAKDKVIMGAERKSMMSEDERKLTAYHESGHALIALLSPKCDPIHKVTIIPRGDALGMVVRLPEKDKVSVSKTELLSNIKVAMGGRASEEIFFGEDNITTGASNDIERATSIAKNMIIKWGMSDQLGFRAFFTSQYYGDESDKVSQRTSEIIDKEVEELMKTLYEEVKSIIIKHKAQLERIATILLDKETLTGIEVKQIFDGTYTDTSDLVENSDNKTLDEFSLGGLPSCDTLLDEKRIDSTNVNSNNNDNNKDNSTKEQIESINDSTESISNNDEKSSDKNNKIDDNK